MSLIRNEAARASCMAVSGYFYFGVVVAVGPSIGLEQFFFFLGRVFFSFKQFVL